MLLPVPLGIPPALLHHFWQASVFEHALQWEEGQGVRVPDLTWVRRQSRAREGDKKDMEKQAVSPVAIP